MEYQGTVKFFDPDKAYGFISGGPKGDVFIHRNNLAPGWEELVEGQDVVFKVRAAAKGDEAYDVVVTRESSLPPRPRKFRDNGGRNGSARGRREPERWQTFERGTPVDGEVISVDRDGRFLFVRSNPGGQEVYVHSSLFSRLGLRCGDRVSVTVEEGPRGLRATSLSAV
ncbi:cold shock domain-containing protein [bacterium]|nr:cold shock domain-containing protein [bacterium]